MRDLASTALLHRHLEQVHGEGQVVPQCVICDKQFGSPELLAAHMAIQHRPGERFSCPEGCDGKREPGAMIMHLRERHEWSRERGREYVRSEETRAADQGVGAPDPEVRSGVVHPAPDPAPVAETFECLQPGCEEGFASRAELSNHRQLAHELACGIGSCLRHFRTDQARQRHHELDHNPERPIPAPPEIDVDEGAVGQPAVSSSADGSGELERALSSTTSTDLPPEHEEEQMAVPTCGKCGREFVHAKRKENHEANCAGKQRKAKPPATSKPKRASKRRGGGPAAAPPAHTPTTGNGNHHIDAELQVMQGILIDFKTLSPAGKDWVRGAIG